MIIDTPIHVGLDWPAGAQPIAVECPVCFAIVCKVRLAEHQSAVHAEGGE